MIKHTSLIDAFAHAKCMSHLRTTQAVRPGQFAAQLGRKPCASNLAKCVCNILHLSVTRAVRGSWLRALGEGSVGSARVGWSSDSFFLGSFSHDVFYAPHVGCKHSR
eukprot:1161982-Pelagomonas_calceolata.AAC.6